MLKGTWDQWPFSTPEIILNFKAIQILLHVIPHAFYIVKCVNNTQHTIKIYIGLRVSIVM